MTIEQKIESAIVTFLKTQTFTDIPSAQIYRGIENATAEGTENYEPTRILPCITVTCPAAAVSDQNSGNKMATPEIIVKSNADDSTNAAHLARCGEVFNVVATTTFAASISAAITDFYCFFSFPQEEGERIDERSWEGFIVLKLMACPSDIS